MDSSTIIATYLTTNGYEDVKRYDAYMINRNGEVWSKLYKKIMKPQVKEDYLCFNLTQDGKRHKEYIHRLLGIQYIENPDNLPEIDHIDRNRTNNKLENLRWVDKKRQNNNKSNNIALKTEEELIKRVVDIKEYKREWAEKDRREKGIQPKNPNFNRTEYNREWIKAKRAEMTDEEKKVYLEKRRGTRPEQTEEQKEKARERAKAQREKIKADPEQVAKVQEYKKAKAQEYRDKKKS
jgi:hypothetical protein